MIFSDAMADLLAPYQQSDGPKGRLTKDGHEYVEIKPGNAADGEHDDLVCRTEAAAFREWRENFLKYMEGKDTIIWRVRPDIGVIEHYYEPVYAHGGGTPIDLLPFERWMIYSRLYAYRRKAEQVAA